ncbi:alpha beta-hydrolase [Dendrothele bispora CBS 962.96]|uniref:Alpha beta-hydrolase n=1 Tax=Dendrothele bispora (strain CBS 962.96) TaxID=1314807 RepID=A0A4S8MSL1_DENBC|nr:alpha beta-hydrolase [Dendrothele bispora CBS 962.96]
MFSYQLFLVGLVLLPYVSSSPAVPLNEVSQDSNNGIPKARGTLHRRDYFYVGGEYVPQGNSTVASGQIYVEHLVPEHVTQSIPMVMIHGLGMTGTNFLNTPDGRSGWADYFMSEGFELYIIDQPSRARSAWQIGIDGNQTTTDTFTVQARFTASERFNLWPHAHLHTQWPGEGIVGDPVFDEFYASTVPSLTSEEESSVKVKAAGVKLLDRIGRPIILLTHSQSGQYGWILADARPSLIKTVIALEPIGPPFINAVFPPLTPARPFGVTEIPLTYSPPISSASDLQREVVFNNTASGTTCFKQASPARKLVNLLGIPMVVVTSESSYHVEYDSCTAGYLKQAGVDIKHMLLADEGIHGNGHMMFMEKNGLEIAEKVVRKWIKETLGI